MDEPRFFLRSEDVKPIDPEKLRAFLDSLPTETMSISGGWRDWEDLTAPEKAVARESYWGSRN